MACGEVDVSGEADGYREIGNTGEGGEVNRCEADGMLGVIVVSEETQAVEVGGDGGNARGLW